MKSGSVYVYVKPSAVLLFELCYQAGEWTDGKGSLVPLVLIQNSEAELMCPTNISKPNITFLKDGELFTSRPVGKVRQRVLYCELSIVCDSQFMSTSSLIVQRGQ